MATTHFTFSEFANSMLSTNTVFCIDSLKDADYGVVYLEEQCDTNVKELFQCYTTFLVTRKYSIEKVRELRMESIIENYIQLYDSNIDREMLRKLYKQNICDTFDKKLNPPKCFFAEARSERMAQEIAEKKDRDIDDIAHHYNGITDKYKYMYAIFQQGTSQTNGKNEDDSDVLSEKYHCEYDEDYSHYSYNSDYNYDDCFSDTDSDCMSD